MHTGYRCVLLTAHSCTCMTKGSKCMAVSILKLKSRLFQAKYRPTSTGYPVSLPPLRRGQKPQKPRENPPASSGSSVLYIKMVLFGKRPYECIGSDQVNGWSQVIELSRETTSGLENRTAFWRQARVVYSGYLHTHRDHVGMAYAYASMPIPNRNGGGAQKYMERQPIGGTSLQYQASVATVAASQYILARLHLHILFLSETGRDYICK
jgi:hypothetical protein